MALTTTGIGVETSATAGNTITKTGIAVSAGDMIVLGIACDNNGGSGAAPTVTVTDNVGNTYTLQSTTTNTAGADDDGVALYIFTSLITNTLIASDVITATFSTSPTCRLISGQEINDGTGTPTIRQVGAGATGTSTTPTITTGTCQVDDVIIGFLAAETTNAFTVDGDTTNGNWSAFINGLANGGTQTTSIRLAQQVKTQTTTSSTQTFNPTIASSRDWATNYIVLYDGSAAYSITADAGSYAVSGTAASGRLGRKVVAGTASYAISGTAVTLKSGKGITADGGSYAISGTPATFRKTWRNTAASGTYVISGTAASPELGRKVVGSASSYAISGTSTNLRLGKSIIAAAGAYAVSGTNASLIHASRVAADSGSYLISGSPVTLTNSGDGTPTGYTGISGDGLTTIGGLSYPTGLSI